MSTRRVTTRWFLAALLVIMVFLSTAAAGRAQEPETPSADDVLHAEVSAAAAQVLGEFFLGAGIPASVHGATMEAFGRTLTVNAFVESLIDADPDVAAGILFRLELDGEEQTPLKLGSAGVGPDRDTALRGAVFDWVQGLGPGVAVVMEPGRRYPQEIPVAGYGAYPGNMLVRGTGPGGWVDGSRAMHEKILEALAPNLVEGEALVSLELQVVMKEDGETQGECRINGEKHEVFCAIVKSFPWPAGEYLFKQFYILVPASPQPSSPERGEGG